MCDATFLADDFEVQDILKIIWAIDINKAHGHDNRYNKNLWFWYFKTIVHNIVQCLKFWNLSRQLKTFKDCTSSQQRKQAINTTLSCITAS